MKHKFFLATAMIVTCSIMISAFVPKPFAYTFSSITPELGEVKDKLELSQAIFQTKGKTSTTSSSYTISNAKSLVRIKINDAVFQSLDNSNSYLSPSDNISLYKLSSGKTSRSFVINTDGTTNAALILVNFIPTETRTYTKMAPAQALIPGEYAFVDLSTKTADGNITVWTFGIDN